MSDVLPPQEALLLRWVSRRPGIRVRLASEEGGRRQAETGQTLVLMPGDVCDLPLALPLELVERGAAQVVLDLSGSPEAVADPYAAALVGIASMLGLDERLGLAGDGDPAAGTHVAGLAAVGRRALFGLKDAAEDALPSAAATHHARLRRVVRALATGSPDSALDGVALDLASAGCTACGVCPKVCPEQALTLDDIGGSLGFDPSRCTGCGLCLQVCDPNTLSSSGVLSWSALLADPVVLERFTTTRCDRCQDTFVPTQGQVTCPACTFRAANPFGSHLPPGARRLLEAYDRRTPPPA